MHKQIEPTATSLLVKVTVVGILGTEIDIYWPEVEPFITLALVYADNKYESSDIKEAIINRDMQLWVAKNSLGHILAVCVTQLMQYPQCKRLVIVLLAGFSRQLWFEYFKIFELYAKENNCDAIEIWGRPGWERVFKDKGFSKIHTVLKLEL